MPPVKGHDASRDLMRRIRLVRKVLGLPRKPLTQTELQAALARELGDRAPSLSTVKRWEQKAYGRISSEDAAGLAQLARCDVDWLLTGKGSPPGTIRDASTPHRVAMDRVSGSGAPSTDRTTSEPRHRRSEAGYLLRALTAQDPALRTQVSEGGAGYGEVARIYAHQAGQMLADRVAAIFKETFESNEIANTVAGRAFTIAFLERVVDEFGELGLNVTDMARYVIELRRSQRPKGEVR